jgi:hypothetical protein
MTLTWWSSTWIVAWRCAVLFAGVGIAFGGELALLRVPWSSATTWQTVWTLAATALLLGLSTARPRVRGPSRVLLPAALGLLTVSALFWSAGARSSDLSILVSTSSLLLAIHASRVAKTTGFTETRVLMWSSIAVCVAGLPLILAGQAGDNRVLQMTCAFAVILIFHGLDTAQRGPVTRGLALAAVAVAAISIGLEGARSAMLVLLVATVLFTISAKSLSRLFRGTAAMTVLVALTGTLIVTRSFERWLGGDSAVVVGNQAINTNGRVTMWSAAVDSVDGGTSIMFGAGPGSSSRVAEAVNGLASPLNEFVRVFTDFGLLGLVALVSLLGGLLLSGIRCSSKVKSFEGGPTVIALAVGFIILSLTESMLSYSWVFVPAGIVIGFVYNKAGRSSLTRMPHLNSDAA